MPREKKNIEIAIWLKLNIFKSNYPIYMHTQMNRDGYVEL